MLSWFWEGSNFHAIVDITAHKVDKARLQKKIGLEGQSCRAFIYTYGHTLYCAVGAAKGIIRNFLGQSCAATARYMYKKNSNKCTKNDDNNTSIILERYLKSYGIFGIRLATANIHLLVYIKRFSLKFQLKFSVFGL